MNQENRVFEMHTAICRCFIALDLLLTSTTLVYLYCVLHVPLLSLFSFVAILMAIVLNSVAFVCHLSTVHTSARHLSEYWPYLLALRTVIFIIEWRLYCMYLHRMLPQHDVGLFVAGLGSICCLYWLLDRVERWCGIQYKFPAPFP
jgi:hypothetical protein